MNIIKVLTIFGTRAEATKMLPLVKVLKSSPNFETYVCVTAQHREMLDSVLSIFNIKPDFDLDIMRHNQTLTDVTIRALTGIENLFANILPDIVLVHGDTSTTFAGALAAYYHKIKVGHVEAGLRTFDKYQPFPEEINRRMTASIADLNFSPTRAAKENLLRENVPEDSIFITGNTSIDCLKDSVKDGYIFDAPLLNTIDYSKKIIAMTAHRRENIGEPFVNIFNAIKKIACDHPDVEIVYSVHLSPSVREQAFSILGDVPGVHLIYPPLGMRDTHNLMNKSYMVVTDSGGLQEEAAGLKKPVVVLRNVTERPEGLEAGTLILGGTSFDSVYNAVSRVLSDNAFYKKMSEARNPFGDGYASERIRDAILYGFGLEPKRPKDWNV